MSDSVEDFHDEIALGDLNFDSFVELEENILFVAVKGFAGVALEEFIGYVETAQQKTDDL